MGWDDGARMETGARAPACLLAFVFRGIGLFPPLYFTKCFGHTQDTPTNRTSTTSQCNAFAFSAATRLATHQAVFPLPPSSSLLRCACVCGLAGDLSIERSLATQWVFGKHRFPHLHTHIPPRTVKFFACRGLIARNFIF